MAQPIRLTPRVDLETLVSVADVIKSFKENCHDGW
jgi:hypothetical protein